MKRNIITLLLLILTISFTVDGYSQNQQWSGTDKFRNCINSMQSTNDENVRFNYAMNYFLTEHTTTIQLQDACHFLSTDLKKYELCVAAYPNVMNKDHFFDIYNSFSSLSYAIKLYHNTQEKTQVATLQNEYNISHQNNNNNNAYDLLMEKGDLLLSNGQYDNAILIYQQALQIKPDDILASQKIQEANTIKQQQAAIYAAEQQVNTQFNQYIHQGDVYLSSNQVDEAINMYEQAMNLKPGDPVAYDRIKEANLWKDQMNNNANIENQNRSQFDFLIQKGDILLSSQKFDEAITSYQQASSIYPTDQIPYVKIDEANRLKQQHTQANTICTTSETDFNYIKTAIEDQTFSSDMKEMAKTQIQKKCFSIEQMKDIVALFHIDDDKLELIEYMYDYSNQQNRFYEFRSLLSYSSTKKKLDEFLLSK